MIRTIKMVWNPRVNLTHHRFGPSLVENCLQILIQVNFLPDPPRIRLTWVKPVVSRGGSPICK